MMCFDVKILKILIAFSIHFKGVLELNEDLDREKHENNSPANLVFYFLMPTLRKVRYKVFDIFMQKSCIKTITDWRKRHFFF